jgi:hypothetical protein
VNHQVIDKLRSIGCEFGPCLNAYTGMEETVYEFLIPTDEPDFLSQVLSIVVEFAFRVRCDRRARLATQKGSSTPFDILASDTLEMLRLHRPRDKHAAGHRHILQDALSCRMQMRARRPRKGERPSVRGVAEHATGW